MDREQAQWESGRERVEQAGVAVLEAELEAGEAHARSLTKIMELHTLAATLFEEQVAAERRRLGRHDYVAVTARILASGVALPALLLAPPWAWAAGGVMAAARLFRQRPRRRPPAEIAGDRKWEVLLENTTGELLPGPRTAGGWLLVLAAALPVAAGWASIVGGLADWHLLLAGAVAWVLTVPRLTVERPFGAAVDDWTEVAARYADAWQRAGQAYSPWRALEFHPDAQLAAGASGRAAAALDRAKEQERRADAGLAGAGVRHALLAGLEQAEVRDRVAEAAYRNDRLAAARADVEGTRQLLGDLTLADFQDLPGAVEVEVGSWDSMPWWRALAGHRGGFDERLRTFAEDRTSGPTIRLGPGPHPGVRVSDEAGNRFTVVAENGNRVRVVLPCPACGVSMVSAEPVTGPTGLAAGARDAVSQHRCWTR